MFEHFSARAIAALELARAEARRLEFSEFTSAHLLLGLAAQKHGVAARALDAVGFDVRRGRAAAERRWGRGYEAASDVLPTAEITAILDAAMAIAQQTEPLVVDTQDLLRAILAHHESRGAELLAEAQIADHELLERLLRYRDHVLAGHVQAPPAGPAQHFHPRLLSPCADVVLELATRKTAEFGHDVVGTEQLLIALLEVDQGAASGILRRNGLVHHELEALAHCIIGRGSGPHAQAVQSRWVDEALERAWQFARRDGHQLIGTCHLLEGLLELDSGGALFLLDMLQVNLSTIALDVEQFLAESQNEAACR